MKNLFKIKICYLFLICSTLSSCAVTQSMWVARQEGLRVEGFFIDHERKRVILVNWLNQEESHTNYSLSEPASKLFAVFRTAEKTKADDVSIYFNLLKAKGSRVFTGSGWVSFELKSTEISKEDEELLREQNLVAMGRNKKQEYVHYDFDFEHYDSMTHYPSSQEPIKNFCSETNRDPSCTKITKFSKPWQGVIWNRYTNSEKALRIAATPFTVVADILLTPLYLVGFIGMGISDGAGNVDPRTPQSTNSK